MAGIQTRRNITEASSYRALLSSIEPQNVNEACKDECWVKAMNEELEQIDSSISQPSGDIPKVYTFSKQEHYIIHPWK